MGVVTQGPKETPQGGPRERNGLHFHGQSIPFGLRSEPPLIISANQSPKIYDNVLCFAPGSEAAPGKWPLPKKIAFREEVLPWQRS